MVNQKDTNNQLTDMLEKKYKSFRDFLRYPPSHNDIDPSYPKCDYLLDLERVDGVHNENYGYGYRYKSFVVTCRCLVHKDMIYRYRAGIKFGNKKQL